MENIRKIKLLKQKNTNNFYFVQEDELIEFLNKENNIIVIDKVVFELYQHLFSSSVHSKIIIIDNNGSVKDLNSLQNIFEQLVDYQANKSTHLVGIGGGEITDLTGFIASIYMRGVPVSFVPTTFMAMVDASIGGKNAVNFQKIKNIAGTIYQPQNILINIDFLRTLPEKAILSGFAEVLKIGFLFDANLIQYITLNITNKDDLENLKKLNETDKIILNSIIQICIKHKLRIVAEDEFDQGKRKLLNFGHTIGHSLELEYNLTHGKAVAYGMIIETKLTNALGITSEKIYEQIQCIIYKYFDLSFEKINLCKNISNIIFDKKTIGTSLELPAIKEFGISDLFTINITDFKNIINFKF